MEKNSRSHNNNFLDYLCLGAIIISLMSCGYTPSVDKINQMMIREKKQFDYLLSVANRLEAKYNHCLFHLSIDQYSYRSSFALVEDNQETTIKFLLSFDLDDMGSEKLEKSDSFQKYISPDLLPMFDSIIQIRKNLNCKYLSISNSFIIIEYIGDKSMYVLYPRYIETPIVLPSPCDYGREIDTLIENENTNKAPYGNRLKKENWYYTVSIGCHGIN